MEDEIRAGWKKADDARRAELQKQFQDKVNSTAQCSIQSSARAPAGASGAIFLAACGRGTRVPAAAAAAARPRCPDPGAADPGAAPGPRGFAATAARQAT